MITRLNPTPGMVAARRREAGSAYLIALLALVVLSVMALSVITVSTTEMETGANERGVTRVFYAAEAGLALGVKRAEDNNCEPQDVTLVAGSETHGGISTSSGFQLELPPPVFFNEFNSNLSSVNENKAQYFKVAVVLNSTASELRWAGTGEAPPADPADARTNAQKIVGRTVTFDPHDRPEYRCNDNVENISKIKT